MSCSKRFHFFTALLMCSLFGFAVLAAPPPVTNQAEDRSGTEIFSILTSEIKSLRFENFTNCLEITQGKKKGGLSVSMGCKGGEVRPARFISRRKVLSLLKGFSTVRALRKANDPKAAKKIGKMVIQDFSDLEPAEFDYFLADAGTVILRLSASESYVVDLPTSLFQRLESLMHAE